MKVKTEQRIKETFIPITLSITFENQIELDFFASLCNVSSVCDAGKTIVGKHILCDIRDSLEKESKKVNSSRLVEKIHQLIIKHPSVRN